MGPSRLPPALRLFALRTAVHKLVLLLALFLATSLHPTTALAEETWTTDRPEDITRFGLSEIRFEGDLPVSSNELRSQIRSSTSGFLRHRDLDVSRLEGDIQRIRSHLKRMGYWKVEVALVLEYETQERKTRATFVVTPGVPRFVGPITTAGNQSFAQEEILEWVKQETDDPFDISATDRDRLAIENTYANRGFYEVRVTADIQPAPLDTARIVHPLVYRVEEGPRYVVGDIRVEGHVFTDTDIIRRELTLVPGEALSRDDVDESRARLYSTGYFASVAITPEPRENADAVDVIVRVTERKMRFVGAGVGYGTRDQLRVSGEWGHRNLFGQGSRGSIRGLLATELFPADLVRTGIEGRYVEPWLFNTRTTGTVELSFERRREFFDEGDEEYDLSVVSLLTNVSRQLTRSTRGWATLENEWADVDAREGFELPDDRRPVLTRTLTLTGERDRRNDYFEPDRGFLNRLSTGFSGGPLGGDTDFWRTTAELQWFKKVDKVTFAGRLRVGHERPFGESIFVPDRERFKLGGPSTVRGYDYQEIGPGDFMLLGNVEARIPLFWRFSTGLFLDGGNAWEDVGDLQWMDFSIYDTHDNPEKSAENDVRYAAGVGLRFATPVGPVRVDVARKIKILPVAPGEADDENRWGYDFSLGHVF